jgi:hypothetical protein
MVLRLRHVGILIKQFIGAALHKRTLTSYPEIGRTEFDHRNFEFLTSPDNSVISSRWNT